MDNGGIWPGDESYFQNIRETALQDTIEQLTKELAEAQTEVERLALEIENQQYTITCASEENQQLKESLAEARAENATLVAEFQRLADEPPTLEEIAADLDKIEMLEKQLAEARAEVEHWKGECSDLVRMAHEMRETIFVTNKCTCGKCIYCEFGGTPPATKIEVFRKCESCTELERQNADYWTHPLIPKKIRFWRVK
jgi:predicted RNase H-like nuclease (RuvC/YqgF family)